MGCNKSTEASIPVPTKQVLTIHDDRKEKLSHVISETKAVTQAALAEKVTIQRPFAETKMSKNPSVNPSHNQLDNSAVNIVVPSSQRQLPDLSNFLSLQSKPASQPNDRPMMPSIPQASNENMTSTQLHKLAHYQQKQQQLKPDSVIKQNSLVIDERVREQDIKVMQFSSSVKSMRIWDEQLLSPFQVKLPRVEIQLSGAS